MPEIEELKRLPCRCGGKGILFISKKEGIRYYRVQCTECAIRTFDYQDAEFAVKRWNDVMADRTGEPNNRVIKVDWRALECKCHNCGQEFYASYWNYCPGCGARLKWYGKD